MPRSLAVMRTNAFVIEKVLDPYRNRLIQTWNEDEIEMIEKDHQELVSSYQTETGFKERIERQDHLTMFNDGWNELAGCFQHL